VAENEKMTAAELFGAGAEPRDTRERLLFTAINPAPRAAAPAKSRESGVGRRVRATLARVTSPDNELLSTRLRAWAKEVADMDSEAAAAVWRQMERAVTAAGADQDEDLMLAILERSLPDLEAVFTDWDARTRALPEHDKALLKRAMNALRKRMRLMRLEDESSGSRNPLSRGASSAIVGVRPPEQYPQEVWDLLVRLGRLRDAGHGLLELAGDSTD